MSTIRARQFRANLTRHEARLWKWLKTLRSEGYHFRRQAPFKSYYLDFVCFSRRLVIELDGGGHSDPVQEEHDRIRDRILTREGFRVLRLWNRALDESMVGVTDQILGALHTQAAVRRPTSPPCEALPRCPSP